MTKSRHTPVAPLGPFNISLERYGNRAPRPVRLFLFYPWIQDL